jgi:hypothetical protein
MGAYRDQLSSMNFSQSCGGRCSNSVEYVEATSMLYQDSISEKVPLDYISTVWNLIISICTIPYCKNYKWGKCTTVYSRL